MAVHAVNANRGVDAPFGLAFNPLTLREPHTYADTYVLLQNMRWVALMRLEHMFCIKYTNSPTSKYWKLG
ncbi:hypothetical protein J6590_045379 [Homalodisca vitripennis]|nr:hypothetical protein J6590_045379 [Homalodisca vitripennis]